MSLEKIAYKEAIRETSMFLIDPAIEEKFEKQINSEVAAYKKSMLGISSKEGLAAFLRSNKQSVKRLITVLGISGERFKRVVTMIRVSKGYLFDTEWNEEGLQRELKNNPQLMDEFCDLFLNGRNIEKYQKLIPAYILQYFHIDENVIARICNEDFLRSLIKNAIGTSYNKAYSDYYSKLIRDKVEAYAVQYGFKLENSKVDGVLNTPVLHITDTEKSIVINAQFNLTTSKGQTDYAKKVQSIKQVCQNNSKVIVLNILDGAGWVARASDYKKVFNNCNYFLTLKTIDKIEIIIKDHFNI